MNPDRIVPILLVDDDEGVRALVAEILAHAGYETMTAASADEAFALVSERRPAVAIIDVQLPGRSGYEICRHLREHFGDDVGIMFLSGSRTEAFDRVAGFEFGADDYMVKPFDAAELVARVRGLLRRSANSKPRETAALFDLTPRELEILHLLAEGLNQREIASRLFLAPKTVSKHIEHILRKLDAHSRAEAVARAYRNRLIDHA